jgi:hypothetical protein
MLKVKKHRNERLHSDQDVFDAISIIRNYMTAKNNFLLHIFSVWLEIQRVDRSSGHS